MTTKQRYSLKPIRRNYAYTVYEISELYGITSDTVFRWIRNEGLIRIPHSKKYLVHGSDLATFLENRNCKNKRPCKNGEIYCCKCRIPQRPMAASLKFGKLPNKTIRVSGKCSDCGTRMNTVVSGNKWSENHPLHPDKNASIKPHSGEHGSPRECQTRKGEQLCLNIAL